MLSNCNNQIAIKKFFIKTDEWENTESDSGIFNLVRGTRLWEQMQNFVDGAKEGDITEIGRMVITCISVDRKAIKVNIASKKAEIENLKEMLQLKHDQYELPDGTIMGNKFGNKREDNA